MTKGEHLDLRFILRFYERLFRKLLEDIEEAYQRTPLHVSSRPYIERARSLIQAGLDATMFFEEMLLKQRGATPNP